MQCIKPLLFLIILCICCSYAGNAAVKAGIKADGKVVPAGDTIKLCAGGKILWYRGNVNFQGSNAIVVTLTLDNFLGNGAGQNKMRVGMAYDATTGSLPFTRTSGSTEVAFEYQVLTNEYLSSDNRCREGIFDRGKTGCYQVSQ